jgi:hypothetical protein
MSKPYSLLLAAVAGLACLTAPRGRAAAQPDGGGQTPPLFDTAAACISCHTGLVTERGEDISFGPQWRPSMMANSARDPYWQAGVRRELIDHPGAAALIEDECSACHMPMARYASKVAGHEGVVFAHLPAVGATAPAARLAVDGVSCTACHQIDAQRLGERSSFTGGFHVDPATPAGARRIFGPFEVDAGRTRLMRSASGFVPTPAAHVAGSELCATCHTLITQALGPDGQVVGELPEQVPYLEWRHSSYRDTNSCQSCHMPEVDHAVPVTPVWGQPRERVSRHTFQGGNGFMMRLLARYRAELGVQALPQELDAAAARTDAHLQSEAARVSIARAQLAGEGLFAEVAVENLAGHKLPTAYPSRRAWLHLTVRDARGAVVFESGRLERSGRIVGNDNDDDPLRVEPHHAEIRSAADVQVYESVMADLRGAVTTGLLSAVRYVKDNRVLPHGFDKRTAPADVAVHGAAVEDDDFVGGADRVRYAIAVPAGGGPFRVDVELLYQPIAYRWAQNLRAVDADETRRFVTYYDSMSSSSALVLARDGITVR